jgi:steroid delta-isomerase-like uncharacterized protein
MVDPAYEKDHSMPEIVTRLLDAWNSHDIEQTVGLYGPDHVVIDIAEARTLHGVEGIRQSLSRYFQAFPDLSFRADEVLVDGTRVTLVWTAHGTHGGAIMHIPPTGRRVTVRGVTLLTIDGDSVRRSESLWDVAGLLRAIGLLPELNQDA